MAISLLLLCLLLAKGLDLEGAAAATFTFSSRLIDRFSEEARVHLASKGENEGVSVHEPWPQKGSAEYFRLLLSSDLTRQRIRLGAQRDSLYPSEGGKTFFFGNALDWLHYTWIDIGTPSVSFLVALDTGSDNLWVPCDCTECAPLSAGHYNVLDRDLNQYIPSLSSTSRHVPCGHQLCNLSSGCKAAKDPCHYVVNYASQNTSSSGLLIEDKLHLASNGGPTTHGSVQASIILGCGSKQSGGYLEGAAPDGVLGLGPGSISVPSLLAKAGLIRNSFSICLNENDSGRILFGDQGHVTQHSTPFLLVGGELVAYFVGVESFCVGSLCLKQTGFQALVDTGTSFTFLPNEVYKEVVLEFDKQVNASRIKLQQAPWDYCYNASSLELMNVPRVKLTFSKNQTFSIQSPLFTFADSEEYSIFCFAVNPTDDDFGTIGRQDSLEDRANFTSPSNGGSSNPLPANQQQSVPNTRAVPPAVAGQASPKPSAATTTRLTSWCFLTSLSLISCHLLF